MRRTTTTTVTRLTPASAAATAGFDEAHQRALDVVGDPLRIGPLGQRIDGQRQPVARLVDIGLDELRIPIRHFHPPTAALPN
jgi:hypothetical protein